MVRVDPGGTAIFTSVVHSFEKLNSYALKIYARSQDSSNRFAREDGQTMIEYGLIVALISIVAIITLTTVGGNINDVFNSISGKLHS